MEPILYLAHTDKDGTLSKGALEALNAAIDLSKKIKATDFIVGLVGELNQGAADSIAKCGASRFLSVEGEDFSTSRYASDAAAAEALIKASKATIVLAPASSRFSRALPGASHRLEGRVDTHVSGLDVVDGTLHVHRWYYRQRMISILTRAQRPWILLMDSGIFQPYTGEKSAVTLEKVTVALPDNSKKTKVIGLEAPSTDAQTIRPDADLLFVAGAGWTKKQADGQTHLKEAEKLILDFLKSAQASLGSSKSLNDLSSEGGEALKFMSHLNQVGQTGSTPRHPKGLATCCHGEEPHTVGWRFINDRRAINSDANCGWAQGKADVLYVADAFKVMEKVNALLSK